MLLRRFYFVFVVIILAAATACCRGEFQVNTHTSNEQVNPAIAIDAAGNFVVVWESLYQDGDWRGIYGQRYSSNGVRIGDEFLVNTTTSGNQKEADVAMDAGGNFVVVWHGPGDGSDEGIYARRYDPNGEPLVGEFLVNSYTDGRQLSPSVAMNGGRFVIVWDSYYHPTHNWYIRGQLYNSSGAPVGGEFIVSQDSEGFPPLVAMDDSGDFVVVFEHPGFYVYMRRYNSDGTAKGPAVDVSGDLNARAYPAIGMAGEGNYVIAWDYGSDWMYPDIYVRRYDSSGSALGSAFVVNTYTSGGQFRPSVGMNEDGDFAVIWHGPGEGDDSGIFGQRFKSDGTFIGDEFQINTYVVGAQRFPDITRKDGGEFVAVWQSNGQDGDNYGIFGEFGPKICCADFSSDLFVNFRDFAFLAEEWLQEGGLLQTDLFDDNKVDELDLGALTEQWLRPCYQCIQANIYGDGIINFKDYSILAGNWQGQGPLAGDITGNGTVDMADLKALLFHWLSYCPTVVWKPNIYLYPEETTELDVYITFPHGGRVTTSIPNYNNGWQITVEPSGIIDGQYEFLFYESLQPDYGQYEAGWVVARAQLEDFFRNNMAGTGFNQKEIHDFVEYWIPRLTEYPYYALYPQYNEELEEMTKFEFSQRPANLIRLIYSIRGLNDDSLNLQEPIIPPFAREGFTVTEWGVILK